MLKYLFLLNIKIDFSGIRILMNYASKKSTTCSSESKYTKLINLIIEQIKV